MKKRFEYFEVTADAGYWAYGSTIEEAFENAALAMFELMTDTAKVQPKKEKRIELEAEDEISLLHDWLDELLFLKDTEFLFFSKFKVNIQKNRVYRLEGKAIGDTINPSIHEIRDEVKAVTYHLMDVQEEKGQYKVRVIVDL